MNIQDLIKNYSWMVPLVATILGGSIGYIYGQRTKKQERFFNQTYESISQICSPIYHEIKKIKFETSIEKLELALQEFFNKYSNIQTNLFKIANLEIINEFYNLEKYYITYTNESTDENWTVFWYNFEEFYKLIEKDYFTNLKTLYGEYQWNRAINQKEPLMRLLNEFVITMFKLSKTTIFLCLFSIYIGIWELFIVKKYAILLISYSFLILVISIPFWFTFRTMSFEYLSLTNSNIKHKSIIKTIASKLFTKKAKQINDKNLKKASEKMKKDIDEGKVIIPPLNSSNNT